MGYVLMYLTGMRIGVLRNLREEWFKRNILGNKTEEISYVPNKQGGRESKELIVWVGRENIEWIKEMYLEYVNNYEGEPFEISRQKLSEGINKIMREMGGTSHAFRRTKITEVTKEKGIVMANQFIGHKQLETTKGYVLSTLGKKEREEIGKIWGNDIKGKLNSWGDIT